MHNYFAPSQSRIWDLRQSVSSMSSYFTSSLMYNPMTLESVFCYVRQPSTSPFENIAMIMDILGATPLTGMLLVVPLTCHFILVKLVWFIQDSSTLMMVFSVFMILRNSIAHCCLSRRLMAEFSDKEICLIFLYFICISRLNTSWISRSLYSAPDCWSKIFLI